MRQPTAPVSHQIDLLSQEYRQLIHGISSVPSVSSASRVRALTARSNVFFHQFATAICEPSSIPPALEPNPYFTCLQSEISAIRQGLLDKQHRMMLAIDSLKDEFAKNAERLRVLFKEKKLDEIDRHSRRMHFLEHSADAIEATFSSQIEHAVEGCREETELLHHEVATQEAMAIDLQSAADDFPLERVESDADIRNEIETEFRQRLADAQAEADSVIEQLETVNRELHCKLNTLKEKYEAERSNLMRQMADCSDDLKLRDLEAAHDAELSQLSETFATEENELNVRLSVMQLTNADRLERLREETSSFRSQADIVGASFARQMKLAESQLQSEIRAKESDLKQLQADQTRALDQLQAQHSLDIERARADARRALAALEDEIIQTVALQEQSRRAFEAEIGAMRAANDRINTSPRLKPHEPDTDQIENSPRRKLAQVPPAVDLTLFRQAVSDADVECAKAVAELDARRMQRDLRTKAAAAQFRQAQSQFQAEQLDLEHELGKIRERLSEVPTTFETIELSPRETELMGKIALQKSAIMQMRDEAERYRVEVPKRKALLGLQAKRREAIAELQKAIDNVRSDQLTKLNDVINELSQGLREQRLRDSEVIADMTGQLDGALEQRRQMFKEIEERMIASVQKWRELRNDISSSTISLCTRSAPTPMAFSSRPSEPTLPSLTKP
jgi:hypothetical protein